MLDAEQRRLLAREAQKKISSFLATHDVRFNGAGEAKLPSVLQAWDIEHTDRAQGYGAGSRSRSRSDIWGPSRRDRAAHS